MFIGNNCKPMYETMSGAYDVCMVFFFFFCCRTRVDDAEIAIDYDYSGVAGPNMNKTRVLFETIGEIIGRSARATISLESNFYALGGNSLNSIYTVAKLRDRGFFIEITHFISARNLAEVLSYMTEPGMDQADHNEPNDDLVDFVATPLAMDHKDETIR